MTVPTPNAETIRATWRWLAHSSHGVSEVRAIRPRVEGSPEGIVGLGFFDDEDAFVEACIRANAGANVYVGVQPRPRRFLKLAPNEMRLLKHGAKSKDIEVVSGTVIDLDPVRPKDTATTDAELELAVAAAQRAAEWCESEGLKRPRLMMSGNGAQLWFSLPLMLLEELDRERTQKGLKAFEARVREVVQSDRVHVDSTHDFGRIIKVIGTVSVKGDGLGDRPHRTSVAIGGFERAEDVTLRKRIEAGAPASAQKSFHRRVALPVVGAPAPRVAPGTTKVARTESGDYDWRHPVDMCGPVQRLWDHGAQDRSVAIFDMIVWFAHQGLGFDDIAALITEYDRRGMGKLRGRDAAEYIRHAYEKVMAGAAPDGSINPPCHALQRMALCRVNREPDARCEIYDFVFDIEAAIEAVPADTPPAELEYRLRPILDAIAHRAPAVHGAYLGQLAKRFGLEQRDLRKNLSRIAKAPDVPPVEEEPTSPKETPAIDGEIFEDVASYFFLTEEEEMRTISSFTIRPTARIVTETSEYICGHATTDKGTNIPLRLPLVAFHSKRDLIRHLPSADMQWTGSDNHVQGLLRLLAAQDVPRREGATMLGERECNGQRLWVGPDCIIGEDGKLEPPPIEYVPSGASLHKRLVYRSSTDEDFLAVARAVFEFLPKLNRQDVVAPAIGWFFATPMKPRLLRAAGSFPMLFVSGSAGSGKSTLITQVFWPLFGIDAEPYSVTETEFALLRLLSSTNSVPIFLDEYKPIDMPRHRLHGLHRYLRRIYRGETEERGRQDLSLVTYHLQAPVCIAGETMPSEGALLERIVTAAPDKTTLDEMPACRAALAELRAVDLRLFAPRYIQFCLGRDFDADLELATRATKVLTAGKKVPIRVTENLRAMLLGAHLFEEFARRCGFQVELDARAGVGAVLENVLETEHGAVKNALDNFIEMVAVMAAQGELRAGIHYIWQGEHLALHLETTYDSFRAHCQRINYEGEIVDLRALRRLAVENAKQGGYVLQASERVRFSSRADRRRAVLLDLSKTSFVEADSFAKPTEVDSARWDQAS